MHSFKKLRLHKLLSVITIVIGFVLLMYMVLVEGEPGAIPMLLIAGGTGWYFMTRARMKSQHK